VDEDGERTLRVDRFHLDVPGVTQRVADDVGKQAGESLRTDVDRRVAGQRRRYGALAELGLLGERLEIAGEVEAAGIFRGLATGEVEIAFEHRLHVVDVSVERLAVRLRPGKRKLQLEA